jgi:hypothetical protein
MGESEPASAVKQERGDKPIAHKRSTTANESNGSPQKKAKANPDEERKTGAWSRAEDKLL